MFQLLQLWRRVGGSAQIGRAWSSRQRRKSRRPRPGPKWLRLELLEARRLLDATAQTLPFTQDWTATGLITVDDIWSGVFGIIGFRGDGLTTVVDADPQTILADGSNTPVDVIANQTTPNTLTSGGVAEFEITNPVVALQGSGLASAPFLLLHVNTTGVAGIRVQYDLRDIDGSADNAVQQLALQYRIGSSGNFVNIPGGYVADASTGPNLAALTTHVDVVLPTDANDKPLVQLRIITSNATGSDEWIGIDNIAITATVFNDAFASAIPLTSGTPVVGATTGATAESGEPAHAGDPAQHSVWYQLTVPAGMSATVTVTPTANYDAQLAVYRGTAVNSLTPVASADDGAAGAAEQVQFTNFSGAAVIYSIAVDGFASDSGQFLVNAVIGSASGPSNDAFASAIGLTSGNTVAGTTVGATAESGEPAHAGDPAQHSVWYVLTVPAGKLATVTVTPNYDAQLAVYTGTAVNSLTLVTSADAGGSGAAEQVQFANSGGTAVSYAIAVDGPAGAAGTFNIIAVILSPPPNDPFANRTALTSGDTVAGTTVDATAESGEPAHAFEAAQKSVWYVLTVPAGMSATVTVTPTANYDAQLAVYTGSAVNSLTLVTSTDMGGPGATEQVQFSNVVGSAATYAIAVDGLAGASGTFNVIAVISDASGPNHAPTCEIGPPQGPTDEDGPQTVHLWIRNCSPNDPGQGQIVSFSVTTDKPELFTVPPAVDANGTLTYDPAPNVQGTATVTVKVTDDGGTANGGVDSSFTMRAFVIFKPHPWHNAAQGLDVSGTGDIPDGSVVAADALAIINYINAFGSGAVPAKSQIGQPYGFLDTSGGIDNVGDDFIAPDDALAVINAINAGLGGEGEGFVADVSPTASGTNNPQAPAAKHDEWTDLLSLLALDTARQIAPRRNSLR